MENLQSLKRKIDSMAELQSVVKTMKSLAAVNIRQFERAGKSLAQYYRTVQMGLQVVLRNQPGVRISATRAPKGKTGVVVFGSDQGMCGGFNERIVEHAVDSLRDDPYGDSVAAVISVGERAAGYLIDYDLTPEKVLSLPGHVSRITPSVQDVLFHIEQWNEDRDIVRVVLFYNTQITQASYEPYTFLMLPVDAHWLSQVFQTPWESRSLPWHRMDSDQLFSALMSEYLFVSLFRAFVESLASENAARLASMQGAEKNIEALMDELTHRYHRQRQTAITEELLDIVSGFEALKEAEP